MMENVVSGEEFECEIWDLKTVKRVKARRTEKDYEIEIWDDVLKEWISTEIEYPDTCGYDYENYEDLEGDPIEAGIPYCYIEELSYYGNHFSLILPFTHCVIKIKGTFIDNTVRYFIPLDDIDRETEEELYVWLNNNKKRIWNIFKKYDWKRVDLWRGHYESENETEGYVKVLEGWTGGTMDEFIRKLADMANMKAEDYPDYEVLFVHPQSSNICVQYFDVWVPKNRKNEFMEFLRKLGLKDNEVYKEGLWYRVIS